MFALKRYYFGVKGLYLEFFTPAEAEACYQKALSFGSCVEKLDALTVIQKTSSAEEMPS